MTEVIVVGIGLLIFLSVAITFGIIWKRLDTITESTTKREPIQIPPPQVNVNLKPLEDAINALPNKVLQSIQSSVNTRKGALGELIGYIELEATYDRIVPLGNIVDFMCIKFPTEDVEGCIDFVDIKTGKSSRLSKEQKLLQQLIKDKKINFVKLKVNTQTSETFDDSD